MKRTFTLLISLLVVMVASMSAKAQDVTINLMQGWNWISYPNASAMQVGEALGGFVPMEGDVIKSQETVAEYRGGQWTGGLTHLMPGKGYMYCSAHTGVTSFVFVQTPSIVVATATPTDITASSAVVGGTVTLVEGSHVLLRGVCWGTEPNPDIEGSYTSDGTGVGNFSSTLEGLALSTVYYVRAYAVSEHGLAYGEEITFTTPSGYTVTVSANPEEGGTVAGGGNYQHGQSCSVTATAATGYEFVRWTENGTQVSTDANYTFVVTNDRTLTAQFQLENYTITATANPANGGTVTGGGTYTYGQTCTLTAAANARFGFLNWTRNGNVVSTNSEYSFTVTGNDTLVANFEELIPEGAINGRFSVSGSQQVYFSQGNLQYIGSAATPYWKFADYQWEYIGNSQGSSNAYIDRDLFGWGTSGYNHGAVCYQPWSTASGNSTPNSYYYYNAYGNSNYNLYNQTGQADWGYNPISNGGNQENQWRTLTPTEWAYLFNTRLTSSGIRYAKARVNNVNGVVLLPDDWDASYYTLNSTNSSSASFSNNTITATQWNSLEEHGAVFLPAAGGRDGTSISGVGSYGNYWSASYYNSEYAYYMGFGTSGLDPQYYSGRFWGFSVRLVRSAQ